MEVCNEKRASGYFIFFCPGHTFTDHLAGSTTDQILRMTPGNDNFRSPIGMHNASTTKYNYGCNKEIYRLIGIVTNDAVWYPWLILRQIRECVTWA